MIAIRKYRADIVSYSMGIYKDFFFLKNAKEWVKKNIGSALKVTIEDRRSGKVYQVRDWYSIVDIEVGGGYHSISLPPNLPRDNYDF